MAALDQFSNTSNGDTTDQHLFERIVHDLETQGYSVRPGALPENIAAALHTYQQNLHSHKYSEAGIGRGDDFVKTEFIRTDAICWINEDSEAGQLWIDWTSKLQRYLNQRLFLGLFSFESHFAHYAPGAYYKRHYDAFRGEANRVLSVVTYLNPGWGNADGGELVLYRDETDQQGLNVVPLYRTIVVFLSEECPHEVLPANRDRYSIAGWFRVNSSIDNKIDPPS